MKATRNKTRPGYPMKARHYRELTHWVKMSRSLTWGEAARAVRQQFGKIELLKTQNPKRI